MARTLVGGSGWLLAAPVSPMWAIARVPCQTPPPWNFLDRGPKILCFSRRPTGVGPAVAGVAVGVMAGAARAALWGRLDEIAPT
jgi:hypothetical protein